VRNAKICKKIDTFYKEGQLKLQMSLDYLKINAKNYSSNITIVYEDNKERVQRIMLYYKNTKNYLKDIESLTNHINN
jgi:hypothetical protein